MTYQSRTAKRYVGARMGRQPLYENVKGAPFKIGEAVRVVGPGDETFDRSYLGRAGVVRYFEYRCGCGQSYPDDPMIGVELRGGKKEEFWKEELVRLTRANARSCEPRGRQPS